MNIKGKIVTLRAIEKEDLELMREMLNDPEMENLVVGWAFPVSKYEQEKWYENNITNKNNLRFIIELDNKKAVGLATLTDIDWKNRKATHGMKLVTSNVRRKGVGTDTVMAIMRYAFEELHLNRLDGSWFKENIASKNMYMKCGWQEEGCFRSYIFKKGKYRDLIPTGILKEDYEKLILENHYWDK